jgi:hypothetical protein
MLEVVLETRESCATPCTAPSECSGNPGLSFVSVLTKSDGLGSFSNFSVFLVFGRTMSYEGDLEVSGFPR